MARTPLHQAAVRGTQDRVRDTIGEGYDVNEPDADGLTPLHMAAINNNYGAAKTLLEVKSLARELPRTQPLERG